MYVLEIISRRLHNLVYDIGNYPTSSDILTLLYKILFACPEKSCHIIVPYFLLWYHRRKKMPKSQQNHYFWIQSVLLISVFGRTRTTAIVTLGRNFSRTSLIVVASNITEQQPNIPSFGKFPSRNKRFNLSHLTSKHAWLRFQFCCYSNK